MEEPDSLALSGMEELKLDYDAEESESVGDNERQSLEKEGGDLVDEEFDYQSLIQVFDPDYCRVQRRQHRITPGKGYDTFKEVTPHTFQRKEDLEQLQRMDLREQT